MSRLTPEREAEIGRALSVRFYTDEAKWALGDYIAEVAALRAELADLQRDRDDLARQAEAAAEVNRQLDAEVNKLRAGREEILRKYRHLQERHGRLVADLAEAKARVAAIEETLAAIRGDAPRKDIATPEGEMRPTNTGVVAERA